MLSSMRLLGLLVSTSLLLTNQFVTANLQASPTKSAPNFLPKTLLKNYYDGQTDDLLTAGWSSEQLSQRKLPAAPDVIDATWLRKAAYYNNIIALLDTTLAGGYSRLYATSKQPISGFEYLTYSQDSEGQLAASLMLQIPDHFNWEKPCIIVAASSGSRGIYGAVGTVGLWALERGCAVAYTDKGTGTGFYLLDQQAGYRVNGLYTGESKTPAKHLIFTETNDPLNKKFIAKHPTAISTKHAYSGKNVEKNSGLFVIQAAEFALYQLNQHGVEQRQLKTHSLNQKNTTMIAASISNGGAASLHAGEQDQEGLFDAIVVAEPNIYPPNNVPIIIHHQQQKFISGNANSFDYFITKNMYGPCALLTPDAINAPFANHAAINQKQLEDWCLNLERDGLLSLTEQKNSLKSNHKIEQLASRAWRKITQVSGARKTTLDPMMQLIELWPALATTYTNQFGRYKLQDNLCSVYFSAVDPSGIPTQLTRPQRQSLFAMSNGIPPTAGIKLVSSQQLDHYQQAKCFYQAAQSQGVKNGVAEVKASGKLNQIPTIIIHGQDDNLINPNLSSRTYYAEALLQNKDAAIKYYEVTNAQHFDAFTALPDYATKFVPLHYYFEKSLDLMMNHLIEGEQLPASQVVVTRTRQFKHGNLERLSTKHLPAISPKADRKIILNKAKNNKAELIIPD